MLRGHTFMTFTEKDQSGDPALCKNEQHIYCLKIMDSANK